MDKDTDLYRGIFSSHPHATVLFGLSDGVILDVNDAALALYGYGRGEMIGLSYASLFADPEAKVHRRKDGSKLMIEAHRSTLSVEGREVGVAVIRDLTRAGGAGGLARDLDGLLAAIVRLTNAASPRKDLDEIRSLSLRAAELTHRLLEA